MVQQKFDDNLKDVIAEFANKASERINKGIFTSEDNLRYLFYMTYVRKMRIGDNKVVLEARYRDFDLKNPLKYEDTFKEIKSGSSHLELDALMLPNIAMEFKYHKDSSQQTHPKTHRAGSVINDFNRLSTLDKYNRNCLRKFAVYVYESDMNTYYQHGNRIENVFKDLKESEKISFDPNDLYKNDLQKTIQKAAFGSFKDKIALSKYHIKLFKKVDINGKLFVRVFEIE